MTVKLPALWPETCYIRPIKHATEGQRAFTHLAELKDPNGITCRGYVKHFPTGATKGLFNEWFGYTVMASLGIPQPPCAIMQAPVFGSQNNEIAYAFVSCQPSPVYEGTPKEHYTPDDAVKYTALLKRLFDCPALPSMIAADQLLMNGDRNLGNLVFTGKSTFVAIDHGEILSGIAWLGRDLVEPTSWVQSKPMEVWTTIDQLKPSIKSAIYACSEVVQERIFEVQRDLREALDCKNYSDNAIALDAVWWRCLNLANWHADRLQLLV